MNCRRADRLMSDSLRGDISPHDAESLDLHLQACEQCRDAYESDQATLQRVDRALHRPSDDFVTETMNAVRTAAATEGRDTSLPAGRATGRWRWTTGRATLAAAAFVAVVAIASWLLYPRAPAPGLPRETPRVAVDQAPSPPVEPAVVEDEPAPVLVADEESTEPAPTPHVAHRPSIRREASSAIASRAGGASEGSATDWRAPGSHGALKPGDVIETGADGGLLVEFGDGSSIDVAAETHLVLGDREGSADRPSTMKLLRGDIMVAVQPGGGRFEVWTPAAVAEVQGTEFVLSASEHATVLAVLDGTVLFRNDTGRVTARKMERAIAGIGHAPTEPSELVGREWARDWRQYAAGEMWRIPGADDPAAEAPPEGAEPGDTRERPRTSTSTDVLVVQATEAPPDVDDAPDTDRTDPVAVARAYVEACRSGDVDIAVSLLIADDPFTLQLRDAAAAITGETESEYAAAFSRLFAESSFLPTRLQLEAEAPVVDLPGDGSARVTVNRTWGLDQQLVMQQAEDGTWSIRPIESIKATTNSDTTLVEAQVSQASTVGGNDSYRVMSESEKRLRTLARGFDEYAKEHDSTLPPTATWVDAIEPYVLDRQAFSCPAAPDEEYGYAMNAQAGELQLPPGYTDRRKLFILSEWRGGGRNASATTEELRAMEPLHTDGTII
ncbi:MAG TPA: FecR domain-containing protein, partial [Armatimonadota bacterium]|nr:FecR domain-containing protein [Armatimonadota bacterium]